MLGAVVGAALGGGTMYLELSRELAKVAKSLGGVQKELYIEQAKRKKVECLGSDEKL